MPRKLIALKQFEVEADRDDAIANLVHRYRACGWQFDLFGCTPNDIMRAARDHARTCDGRPQPRPEFTKPLPARILDIWGPAIEAALAAKPLNPSGFVTGLPAL